jgi:hypothetical protein
MLEAQLTATQSESRLIEAASKACPRLEHRSSNIKTEPPLPRRGGKAVRH